MITILCSGSRGDFQPYIALAVELQKLGKQVRIAAGESFEGFIKENGVGFYRLTVDYKTANIDPDLVQAAQSSDNVVKMLFTFNKMKDLVINLSQEMFEACKGSELILYHPGCSIGYFAGETLKIPSALCSPFPIHKTKEVASVIAYGKTKMPISLSYKLLQGMLWMAGKTGVEAVLKKELGKLPEHFGNPFEKIDKAHPAYTSCSNYVFPRAKDWAKECTQFGYWFLQEDKAYTPSGELSDFLEKGKKPLYIGFGSVFNPKEKESILKIILEALELTQQRAILSGFGTLKDLPETCISVDSIPHTWLFDQVSLVIHHGGAGTTAAGFRAGVPSVIIPFSNDQFAWAHRAYDLGVGAHPIYRKRLTSKRLATEITFALQDKIIHNAQGLGEKIRQENGAYDSALDIIKRLESQTSNLD